MKVFKHLVGKAIINKDNKNHFFDPILMDNNSVKSNNRYQLGEKLL